MGEGAIYVVCITHAIREILGQPALPMKHDINDGDYIVISEAQTGTWKLVYTSSTRK